MAFGNGKRAVRDTVENPVKVFLDYQKGKLITWDKEQKMNVEHPLNKFIILDIGYTFKWKERNETLRNFVSQHNSNEIKDWDQTLHIIKMVFVNKEAIKDLVISWTWAQIKEEVKWKWNIHLALTVLDLDDWIVKEFFISWTNFFNVSSAIKNFWHKDILSFESKTTYERDKTKEEIALEKLNNTYDEKKKKVEITLEQLNELKWIEASKYKARYNCIVVNTWETIEEDIEKLANETSDWIDAYHEHVTEYYTRTYWISDSNWVAEQTEQKQYAKLDIKEEEETKEKVKEETKSTYFKPKEVEKEPLSISDIPF